MDLKNLLILQHELDSYIKGKHPDLMSNSISEWVKQITIAMEDEISEVRAEINWKHWKAPKEIDMDKLHGEVVDLWFFLSSLTNHVGLSPERLEELYREKYQENIDRQNGQSKEKDYRG